MLDYIRRQNIGIKIVLSLVVLSFIIFYAGSFSGVSPHDPSRNMAVVGKEQIGFTEFQNMVQIVEDQQQQIFGNKDMTPQMMNFFRQQAINTLIDRKLMLVEARKAGIRSSDDEVRREIMKSPYFTNNGNFVGLEEYQRRVELLYHMGTNDFEHMIGEDVIINKFNGLLTAGLLISDKEIEDAYRKSQLTARVDYVLFENPAGEQIQVSPEEARAYYASHKNEFATGEQRKVHYLWVSHESEKNKVSIPESRLQEYYNANKDRFSRPEQVHARHILLKTEGKDEAAVKKQAEDLVKQLRAGANFADVAAKYSEDPGSKNNGGDLGSFPRGRMVPEFDQAAFSLPVNQISDPIKTQFGYHIIQVTEKQAAFQMDYPLVREQIVRELALPQEMKNAEEQAKRISQDIKTNKKTLSEISKIQFVELRNTEFFSRNEDLPQLSPAFRQTAFELKKGEVSEPVQVFQDFALLQVTDIKASEIPPFEKVQAKATQNVRMEKRQAAAKIQADQFYASLAGATDLKAAADKAKFTVKSSEPFNKGGYVGELGNEAGLSEKAFEMKVGDISAPVKTDRGYIVYQLKEKKEFNPSDFAKQKEELRQQLMSEKESRFSQTYRMMLRQKYQKQIWVNTDALTTKET